MATSKTQARNIPAAALYYAEFFGWTVFPAPQPRRATRQHHERLAAQPLGHRLQIHGP